ncbi:MFS general substrate transporter [Lentinula raphanica]|uniref:MFS general substrate transporter n=1 Tax=Lentinula raphanica TaxID=153919 RepID=A0AA38PBX5_9AGAR|nr:major facilitator superfamily domain-containing protein [Lentinula raphanica]KAJ3829282.1 MFS general substrate transporter [Lentinula raphanica]KAJ3840080.1 MFS general substrate transporter [Lentinula raphanica]KAJ3974782.1 MFS general substrate transporter [Lentinula raphanica]
MSLRDEKGGSEDGAEVIIHERPTGWRGVYYSPLTQVVMLGFVCFMGPGLFNAVNGLGGGGQLDPTTSANSNVAVYAAFAVVGFFAGSINNTLGSKLTLQLGTFGYCLYIGSYLALNIHPHAGAFVIAAGAVLGVCAGLLWAAQGSLMLAYPTEPQKGTYIAIFWAIFNLGGVVGAAVSLGTNFHNTAGNVSNSTYIGFIVLTAIGICIPSLLMADPSKVVRSDGVRVTVPLHPSWKTQLWGLWLTLKTDPMIILLFPMFFVSNWFYTWQFNDYNGALFDIRTRGLNNLLYWTSQIFGSIGISFMLDSKLPRRTRAFGGWTILMVMIFITHIWAYFYQIQYVRPGPSDIDLHDKRYIGRAFLYVFFGLLDSMWQTTAYWLMGAISNDAGKLAIMVGFYKSMQSAGAAGVFRADAVKTPFMTMLITTWVLLVAGLIFALPMIHLRVKNHTDIADETLVRMDSKGQIRDVEQVKNEETVAKATV